LGGQKLSLAQIACSSKNDQCKRLHVKRRKGNITGLQEPTAEESVVCIHLFTKGKFFGEFDAPQLAAG
jgi:hypothetical protein